MAAVVLLGVLLGMASAVEEATAGFDVGISSDGLWLAAAFACGASADGRWPAAARGALVLTAANLAYYAVGGDAPNPGAWLALGVAGGLVFGAAGPLWKVGSHSVRLAALSALAAVFIVEGSEVFRAGGEVDDGVELALGCILPVLAARGTAARVAAATAAAALTALGAAGIVTVP